MDLNFYEVLVLGAVIGMIGTSISAYVLYLQTRLKNVESKLVVTQQKVTDSEIVTSIHNLSDPDLAGKLACDLGPNDEGFPTPIVPKS